MKKFKKILLASSIISIGSISIPIFVTSCSCSGASNSQASFAPYNIQFKQNSAFSYGDTKTSPSKVSIDRLKEIILNNLQNIFEFNDDIPENYNWRNNIIINVKSYDNKKGTILFELKLTNANEKRDEITKDFIFDNWKKSVYPFGDELIIPKEETKYDGIDGLGTFSAVDSSPKPRNKQNEYYNNSGLLINRIPVAKYPSYKYNYKVDSNRRIQYNGQQVDLQTELLKEKTPDGNRTYNNPDFIREEIKNNRLKKHPYSKDWPVNVDNINNCVDRTFTMSTSVPGVYPLGLWAPAGEVIEVQLDEPTWQLISSNNFQGINIDINHNYFNSNNQEGVYGDNVNLSNRYPHMRSSFTLNKDNIDPNTRTLMIGSPFGGNISLVLNEKLTFNDFSPSSAKISLTVKNAIPTLHYIDGTTTEQDWNKQISDFKNGLIAPSFDASFTYGSILMPFSGENEIGGYSIDKLVYPKLAFKKLNDFLFLSNYFNLRDKTGSIRKLDMQYNSDVWNGAVGWGGGNTLWVDSDSGVSSFLIGDSNFDWWSFNSNWLVFHEINHNFEQNNAFFKVIEPLMHTQTNQVNLFNFAKQGDIGRYRNEWNIYGEQVDAKPGYSGISWSRLANSFCNIAHNKIMFKTMLPDNYWGDALVTTDQKGDEYVLYKAFMDTFGPDGYVDYVRWDVQNHPNNTPNWTYMSEIAAISDFFKINMWPAIRNAAKAWNWNNEHSPLWNPGLTGPTNRWPESDESATPEEKQIIDRLNRQYKSFDFMGNLYAVGQYLYKDNKFIYTSDSLPAYEIPAGQKYTFDFQNYIVSANPDFAWDNLEFSNPLFGKIQKDPTNPKKLIYTPDKNHIGDIDEFDVSIMPTNFKNKPSNYVPQYKWKIKVRQNVNGAHFLRTERFDDQQTWDSSDAMFDRIKTTNVLKEWDYGSLKQWYFDDFASGDRWKKTGLNTKFYFVATEDGDYTFDFKWANAIRIKVNNKVEEQKAIPQGSGTGEDKKGKTTITKTLTRGDKLLFDIDLITNNNYPEYYGDNPGEINLEVTRNGEFVNYNKNILLPIVDQLGLETDYINYLINEKYQYHRREIDYTQYQDNSISKFAVAPTVDGNINKIPTNDYWFDLNYDYEGSPQFFNEDLKNNYRVQVNQNQFSYWANFNEQQQAQELTGLAFRNDWGYIPTNERPSDIKVEITDTNNQTHVAYDGTYGEFNDRDKNNSYINFDKPYYVKHIKITLRNKDNNVIKFNNMFFLTSKVVILPQAKEIIALNNNRINLDAGWVNVMNDPKFNLSRVNNSSFYSNVKDGTITFILDKGTKGFSIAGRSDANDSAFDVYIDNQLVGTSIVNPNNKMQFNHLLYSNLKLNHNKSHTIKLVQKEEKDLYIDYVSIY